MPRFNPPAPAATRPIVRLTVDTVTQGQHCQTTCDWQSDAVAPLTFAEIDGFVTAWDVAFLALFQAVVSPLTAFFSRIAADIFTGVTPTVVHLDAPGVLGTAGAANLPLEMAATVTKVTGLKGQHGRGRLSMPAVPTSFTTPATDPNQLNAAALAAYNPLFAAWLGGVSSFGINYVPTLSTRPVPPSPLVSFAAPILSFDVRPVLGTARTRKEGRGI